MTITTLSSREFQQNANLAQKASHNGPVIITNRGKPAQVLLSITDYQRMIGKHRNIVESEEATFKEIVPVAVFPIHPPGKIDQELLEDPLQKFRVRTSLQFLGVV